IQFGNAIIATGASALRLPGINYASPAIMNSEEALEMKEIPQKLLIVGGGYIGIEMAIIYHEFGSKVSIVELTPNFLPKMDADLVAEHKRAGKDIYEDIFMETSVEDIVEEDNILTVTFKGKE